MINLHAEGLQYQPFVNLFNYLSHKYDAKPLNLTQPESKMIMLFIRDNPWVKLSLKRRLGTRQLTPANQ